MYVCERERERINCTSYQIKLQNRKFLGKHRKKRQTKNYVSGVKR